MYISTTTAHYSVEDFQFPVGFQLGKNNRLVILSQLISINEF